MYTPKFSYTDKLVTNLLKIENHKTTLNSLDLAYNTRYRLALENKSQDIFHLAHMLGITMTFKEAERVANGLKIDELESEQNQILSNYKKAYELIRNNDTTSFPEIDKSIMLSISKIMLLQWRETWEASFRNFNDKIDDSWDSFAKLQDKTITGPNVDIELEGLIEWHKFAMTTVPAVVRIAIVLFRLIEIAPFIAGNKFIILLTLDNMMLRNGLGSKIYFSTLKMIHTFEERLQKSISAVKITGDLSVWIEAFTSQMLNEIVESRENLSKFLAEEEKSKQQPFLDLNKRQLKILKYLQNVPSIKREDYCQIMEVSTMTAFRDLNELVRKKLLKIEGQGRGTKYKLISS